MIHFTAGFIVMAKINSHLQAGQNNVYFLHRSTALNSAQRFTTFPGLYMMDKSRQNKRIATSFPFKSAIAALPGAGTPCLVMYSTT